MVGVWGEGFALLFGLRRPRRRTGTAVPCPCHAVLRARLAWGFGVRGSGCGAWAAVVARGHGSCGTNGADGRGGGIARAKGLRRRLGSSAA